MDRPEGISAEAWDAANEADQKCQKESCKDIGCNGFLCANALRAALLKTREEAFERRPIETAPKDGTVVFVWDGYDLLPAYWNPRPDNQDGGWWMPATFFEHLWEAPITHWIPLPQWMSEAIRQHSQKGER